MSQSSQHVLIIGCGNIAGRFDMEKPATEPLTHAGAFQRHGQFELSACVDPNEVARSDFATWWGITRHGPSLASLAASPGEFEVISICSPTKLHHIHLQSIIPLKPRVIFCEKPMTNNLSESNLWQKVCSEHGISLVVNYTRRWDPAVIRLQGELRAGYWGAIRSAVGFYNKGVMNNGGHLVDLLIYLLGPLEVLAAGSPIFDYWQDDPTVSALLRSKKGHIPVCLAPADANDYSLFELELVCERGVLRMRTGGMHWEVRRSEPSPHFIGYRTLAYAHTRDGEYLKAMTLAVSEIHDHLVHGMPLRSTGADALVVQAVCEKIINMATVDSRSPN